MAAMVSLRGAGATLVGARQGAAPVAPPWGLQIVVLPDEARTRDRDTRSAPTPPTPQRRTSFAAS